MQTKSVFCRKVHFRILMPILVLIIDFFNPKIAFPQGHIFYPYKRIFSQDSTFVSLNVLYKEGTTKSTKNAVILYIQNYYQNFINHVNSARGTHMFLNFFIFYCPCDSLLCNVNVIPVGGSGGSINPPPPPPPGPGGSGDFVSIIANNLNMQKNSDQESIDTTGFYKESVIKSFPIKKDKIIAIMDTGLDPAYFKNIDHLIWRDIQHPRTHL